MHKYIGDVEHDVNTSYAFGSGKPVETGVKSDVDVEWDTDYKI